jgi:serine/threonine-protein kinase
VEVRTLGRYEVVGHLASGGMAEVLLGRVRGPHGFERAVVLKRILPHLARMSSFVDMFLDEARIIARIHHPNVVQVHELGSEGGELFMAMEYLAGESVASLVRRLASRNAKLDHALAAFIIAEACAGLHAAHELTAEDGTPLNIVHRDVSPQNLFITFDGAVKVIDFGIAKSADRVARTEAGQLKGKLDFMSPEQCKSEPVDRRTDVFALGVVLYELLTQRRLFKRPSPAGTIKAIVQDPIVPPSRVAETCPKSLEAICMRSLERDPSKRYASAVELRRELVSALASLRSGSDPLPEEQLAALMCDVLAERRKQKEEMLRAIREGGDLGSIPSPEADESEDIPVVAATGDETNASVTSSPSRASAGRSRWPVAISIVVAAGILGAVAWKKIAAPPPRVETVVAPPSAVSSVAATVRVTVESDPPGAKVTIDGTDEGTTPAIVTLAHTDGKHALVVHKDGFVDAREDVSADVDQKLKYSLKTIAVVKPAARAGTPRKQADEPPPKW